ncbi:Sir2 family NAD-dependent protein deacetylase [Gordonia soli]|uniref:NAD-dependent protein deacetylase n=1 Tax=Gordonia soli NBRC 108243 TaxID=1223545 RepID=M0QKQ5_9ACTN|nr:Sir2 family NAD-dependent protein deacetylase [Gordonia soli]GAC69029.1 NAD-dependent deacetylase [Gordonia soli NBRC 108243]
MHTRPQQAWAPAEPTPIDDDLAEQFTRMRALLGERRLVALTGAGISTDSGIPDYRSPGAPVRTPMTLEMFLSSPDFRRHYWARNHLGWRHMDAARPNDAHRALTALQREGRLLSVITQNVDMLHTKAGTRRVNELHGCYGRVRCLSCDWRISRHRLAELLDDLNPGFAERVRGAGAIEVAPDADAILSDTADFRMIDCPDCGGIVKPDIVYFGESVPRHRVAEAYSMVEEAEALLVVGSSLSVMSGLRFVRHAHRIGTPVVIVNRGITRGDDRATLKVDHLAGVVLPMLADSIGKGVSSALAH